MNFIYFFLSSLLLFASVFSVYFVAPSSILLSFLTIIFIHCLFALRCYFTTAYRLCNVTTITNSTTARQLFPQTVAACKNRAGRDTNRCPCQQDCTLISSCHTNSCTVYNNPQHHTSAEKKMEKCAAQPSRDMNQPDKTTPLNPAHFHQELL